MLNVCQQWHKLHLDLLIHPSRSAQGVLHDVEPRDVIDEHHVKGRCGRALLSIPFNSDTVSMRTREKQALELGCVTVVVEMYCSIGSEEGLKVLIRKRMR